MVSKLSIAFLGSANWDLAARGLAKLLSTHLRNDVETLAVPFGQYRTQLLDSGSALRTDAADIYVFCERIEDFADGPLAIANEAQLEALTTRCDEYLSFIRLAREHLSGLFLVLDFAPVDPFSSTLEDATYVEQSVRGRIRELNLSLQEMCNDLADCQLVRLSAIVELLGARQAAPGKYWHLGRMPYSPTFVSKLNDRLLGTVLALRGATARVLVLDLDNTLWGGVVGDDGVKGIKLGGDFPGNVFVEIQKYIRALKDQGIVLAICSKNTPELAIEAIEKHPDMQLRLGDFAAIRIGWRDKAEFIREIAEELGLSPSSICLLDDSPYERDAVRSMVPEVIVPDLPADPALWIAFLADFPYLSSLRLTLEDRGRAESYKARARMTQEVRQFASREEYWRSLGMELHFAALSQGNLQRMLQLFAKTNQFNTTTKRYTEADLEDIVQGGGKVIAIGLKDKYSPYETVGALVLDLPSERTAPASIESFLLSCRVLGRGVEAGVLGWVASLARRSGYERLIGRFSRTARNQPAADVYPACGFTAGESGSFVLALSSEQAPGIPDWVRVCEDGA